MRCRTCFVRVIFVFSRLQILHLRFSNPFGTHIVLNHCILCNYVPVSLCPVLVVQYLASKIVVFTFLFEPITEFAQLIVACTEVGVLGSSLAALTTVALVVSTGCLPHCARNNGGETHTVTNQKVPLPRSPSSFVLPNHSTFHIHHPSPLDRA